MDGGGEGRSVGTFASLEADGLYGGGFSVEEFRNVDWGEDKFLKPKAENKDESAAIVSQLRRRQMLAGDDGQEWDIQRHLRWCACAEPPLELLDFP